MANLKRILGTSTIATIMGFGALLAAAPSASAYITCNRDGGDCWHADKKVRAPNAHFDYHPDDWYFHQKWEGNNDRRYRDYHEGRGYYKGGIWITL